ncbi:hypothetical protein HY406_01045, partial [Candidatus Giovannonibacteria bacterium]|nr:hypothetical protein [Candidatus Giovannonibacteria bacterium]
MENKKFFKRPLFLVCILVVLGAVVFGVTFGAPPAQANFLENFFRDYVSPLLKNPQGARPFGGPASSTAEQQTKSNVPLYKPVIDYENAVVAAVKKASPAVVSITISKNVPVLENCPYSPFSG